MTTSLIVAIGRAIGFSDPSLETRPESQWPAVRDVVDYKREHGAVLSQLFEKFYAGGPPPASTWLGISALALPGFLIEIEATAVIP